MAKRFHNSKSATQHADKFNDETHHNKSPMRMGPYHYDRQEMQSEYRRGNSMRDGFYAGAEPRRRQEMADAGMVHEDPRAVANLPQHVISSYYPKDANFLPEDLDDTLMGIDRQLKYDNGKKMNHFYAKKV